MIHSEFSARLTVKLLQSLANDYKDNYDYLRFGPQPKRKKNIKEYIKAPILRNNYVNKFLFRNLATYAENTLLKYSNDLNRLFTELSDEESRNLLIDIIAYRILGYQYVKLPINTVDYWQKIETIEKLANKYDKINSSFLNLDLFLFDLKSIGYDVKLYFSALGIATDFLFEQYAYKSINKIIEAKPGDYVIDAGGCWGDTSMYFATKVGRTGKVFSFEFIPKNLEIFERNINLNPSLKNQISVIQHPLWDSSGKEVFYLDNGPGSTVSFEQLTNGSGTAKTMSIDQFVETNSIEKVDFVKMDIEGAEFFALNGAINTIKKFRPNLALAIYHSMDDFIKIPRWIQDLNLGYRLYLGHYTIHAEETIIFATIE